jgi:alpha-L-rhamnosidase
MLDLQARSAALLGKTADAETYRALADKVRTAYNARYWDAGTKRYGSVGYDGKPRVYAQTQNVLPLAFGIVPDGAAADVMRQVNDDIVAHGYHLTTGVYAGRYVMTLLSDYGYADTAYKVATRTDFPSWGYWIENGLSTMAEGWELSSRSWDHHYWASISSYFYQSLAGIRAAAPGYAHLTIKPVPPHDLASVHAQLEIEQGTIESAWQQADGDFSLQVTIPRGTDAEVWLPSPQGRPASTPSGTRFVRRDGTYSVYAVGPGRYRFEAKR